LPTTSRHGGSRGSFRLGPADAQVPASRRYLPGTKILETTWQTRTGWLVVTDFLAVGSWHRTRERSELHRRVPGDFDADHVLVRIATWEYTAAGYASALSRDARAQEARACTATTSRRTRHRARRRQ
jgi:hypothetical protein